LPELLSVSRSSFVLRSIVPQSFEHGTGLVHYILLLSLGSLTVLTFLCVLDLLAYVSIVLYDVRT